MLFLSIFIDVNTLSLIEKKLVNFLQHFFVPKHHPKDRVVVHFLELDVAFRAVFFEKVEAWYVVAADDILLYLLHAALEYS